MVPTFLYILAAILVIIGKFLYKVIYEFYLVVSNAVIIINRYKTAFFIICCFVAVGYPFANKQPMTMQTCDIGYECFFFRALHYASKIGYAIQEAYFWLVSRLNDGILWIQGCIAEGITNIRNASGNTIDRVVEIFQSVIEIGLCFLESAYEIPSWIIPYFSDILKIVIEAFIGVVETLQTQLQKIALGEWFSEDCTFCDIYENDYRPDYRCRFMETSFSAFGVDCRECNTFINDVIDIIADIINGILELCGLDQSVIVYSLADDFKCIFNLGKRVWFIIFAFIDDSINNGNCIDTEQFFKEIGRWALDILGCFDDLMNTITQGQISSFFEYIFSVVLKFFYDIINGIKLIIDCYQTEEQTDCLAQYPDNCAYAENGRSSAGLQTCAALASDCLSQIPFLVNLTNIGPNNFNFFDFGPILASFIDDVVCFFEITIECVRRPPNLADDDSSTAEAQAVLICLADRIPGLRSFFQFIIDIVDIIRGVEQTIECFSSECVREGFSTDITGTGDKCSIIDAIECIPKCFTNPNSCDAAVTGKRNVEYDYPENKTILYDIATNTWSYRLQEMGVPKDSYCGKLLHTKTPGHFVSPDIETDYGSEFAYRSCLNSIIVDHFSKNNAGFFITPLIVSIINPNSLYLFNDPSSISKKTNEIRTVTEKKSLVKNYFNSFSDRFFKNKTIDSSIGVFSYLKDNLWGMFNKTGYYTITFDFVQKMQELNHQMYENGTINYNNFEKVSRGMHYEYARSLLSYHSDVMNQYKRDQSKRIHFTQYTQRKYFRNMRKSVFTDFNEIEKKADALNDVYRGANEIIDYANREYPSSVKINNIFERYKPSMTRLYNAVMSSDTKYWPIIQKAHGYYYLMRNATYNEIREYARGEKTYHIDHGLVSNEEFSMHMKRGGYEYMQSASKYKFVYSLREKVRNVTFLLIDINHTSIFPSLNRIGNVISNSEMKRSERIKQRISFRLEESGDSDLNQWFIDFIDWFISIFSSSKSFFNDLYESIKEDFTPESIKSFFEDTFSGWFIRLITCTIPYNFNGTYVYSPVCLPLLPEYIFEWMQMIPTKTFTIQINWPKEFNATNCTNVFNVPKKVFDLSYSDNCYRDPILKRPQTDGFPRPLCPECDYCERDYEATCKDLGFNDFFDSILFTLGVIPKLFNGYYNDKFTVQSVELTAFWATLFVGSIFRGPFFAVIFTLLEIVLLWFIEVTFGYASYGIMLAFGTLIFVILVPYAKDIFPLFYLIISIAVLSWLISVWIPFTFDWLEPLIWLKSFMKFANRNILFWAPNLDPLIRRVDNFDYRNKSIPTVDIFCFFWSFQNIAIALIVLFFFFFYLQIWAIFNSNVFFVITDLFRLFYNYASLGTTNANKLSIDQFQTSIRKIKSGFNSFKTRSKVMANNLLSKMNKLRLKTKKKVKIEDAPLPITNKQSTVENSTSKRRSITDKSK